MMMHMNAVKLDRISVKTSAKHLKDLGLGAGRGNCRKTDCGCSVSVTTVQVLVIVPIVL